MEQARARRRRNCPLASLLKDASSWGKKTASERALAEHLEAAARIGAVVAIVVSAVEIVARTVQVRSCPALTDAGIVAEAVVCPEESAVPPSDSSTEIVSGVGVNSGAVHVAVPPGESCPVMSGCPSVVGAEGAAVGVGVGSGVGVDGLGGGVGGAVTL